MNILVTCPPMIGRYKHCAHLLAGYQVTIPEFSQTMSEEELVAIVDGYDGWIAGDDPVTRQVLAKAKKLKVLIKWGIGTDNIDLEAVKEMQIPFHNTPAMFGNEVADVAIGYLIGIVRNLCFIDREVRKGNWPKPAGVSLSGKKVAVLGFGDIGRNIVYRLLALRMDVWIHDPGFQQVDGQVSCLYSDVEIENHNITLTNLTDCLTDAAVVILSCPLLESTKHVINSSAIDLLKDGSYLINVSRGGLVREPDVLTALQNDKLAGFASDVFETEPIVDPDFLNYNVICGSHNASNTVEAVDKTNEKAISLLKNYI